MSLYCGATLHYNVLDYPVATVILPAGCQQSSFNDNNQNLSYLAFPVIQKRSCGLSYLHRTGRIFSQ